MISIIVPVYNADKYLERCLHSIKSQTYSDWECVLVNDGSRDNSRSICDKWQREDPRYRVIHQDNQGASVARQVGISAAKGEYLSFIDADDVVEPDYIELLYSALVEKNTEISACDFVKHREDVQFAIDRKPLSRVLENDELHQRFFKYEFWGYPGKIYKRHIFDGIYFPKATINEDYVLMAQLFHKCQRMAYVPISLYHYMMHEGSLSNQQISARALEEYENKLWVLEFYKDNNPTYVLHAEAQLTETCIKLLRMIRESGQQQEFSKKQQEMQSFLRIHLFSILRNPHLLLGLKVMTLKSLI